MSKDSVEKQILARDAFLTDELVRQDSDPPLGPPALLAATKSLGNYPATARCYFACQPLTVMGAEVEGGAGVTTAKDATFFALNLGGTVPPVGAQVIATFVGNRWVFRYDG